MAFTIDSFKADDNGNIVSVDWKYTNADGSLGNTHVLATPAGDFALAAVTQDTLVSWLEDQLQNTAAEFDAYLAAAKAKDQYEDSLSTHSRTPLNKYEVVDDSESTPETPEPTPETPQSILGYFPLYVSETVADAAGDGSSHSHTLNGNTYYMPNGLVLNETMFHGTHEASAPSSSSSY